MRYGKGKYLIRTKPSPTKIESVVAEVKRQLTLKSEVTSIGPPYVALNGEDLLAAVDEAVAAEREAWAERVETIRRRYADIDECQGICGELGELSPRASVSGKESK